MYKGKILTVLGKFILKKDQDSVFGEESLSSTTQLGSWQKLVNGNINTSKLSGVASDISQRNVVVGGLGAYSNKYGSLKPSHLPIDFFYIV